MINSIVCWLERFQIRRTLFAFGFRRVSECYRLFQGPIANCCIRSASALSENLAQINVEADAGNMA